jgi:hypothetical protein
MTKGFGNDPPWLIRSDLPLDYFLSPIVMKVSASPSVAQDMERRTGFLVQNPRQKYKGDDLISTTQI